MKKKVIAPILAIIIAAGGWFFNTSSTENSTENIKLLDDIPERILQVQKEGMAPNKYIDAYVVKVSDGDTMDVTYKGETQKVRLLSVDTPESVKAGVDVQTFSKEASELTKELALNKSVKLVFDKGLRDRYGRLLAYVIIKKDSKTNQKEIFLNALLVRNGYARVEIVSPNSALKSYFIQLQEKAIEDKIGMWSLPKNKQPFVKDEKGNYVPRYKID